MADEFDDDVGSICSVRSIFDGVVNEKTTEYRAATTAVRQSYENWKVRWSTCRIPWAQALKDSNGDEDEIPQNLQISVSDVDCDREAIIKETERLCHGLLTESNREANQRQITKANYKAFNRFRRTMKSRMSTKYVILNTQAGIEDTSIQKSIHDEVVSTVPALTISGITDDSLQTGQKTPRGRSASPFYDKPRME